MNYKLYEVGGKVRDELMGLSSKDIDYSFVWNDVFLMASPEVAFNKMVEVLKEEGFEIFLETPDCFTVRAKFPEHHIHNGVADFVMARSELYEKGSRRPTVVVGSLEDDLARRDFTMNAIARDRSGNIIDPHNGLRDIQYGLIRTVGSPGASFKDDPLRILRAIRFSVTKNMLIESETWRAIERFPAETWHSVSDERVREELFKAFKANTQQTLNLLMSIRYKNPQLYDKFFPEGLWLKPTLEQ